MGHFDWDIGMTTRSALMMNEHLDQTLDEAVAQLTGRCAASIGRYDAVERHIVRMADTLSGGIMKQFPARLR